MNPDDAKKVSRSNIVASLLQLEALVLLALVAFLVIKALGKHLEAPLALAGVILFAILGALTLLVSARAYKADRQYGRAPTILLNLIGLGVAYFQVQAHLWVVAIPLGAISLLTVALALSIVPKD